MSVALLVGWGCMSGRGSGSVDFRIIVDKERHMAWQANSTCRIYQLQDRVWLITLSKSLMITIDNIQICWGYKNNERFSIAFCIFYPRPLVYKLELVCMSVWGAVVRHMYDLTNRWELFCRDIPLERGWLGGVPWYLEGEQKLDGVGEWRWRRQTKPCDQSEE